jgi:ubiquinone/menaquinone biosynthesis C-methylase UbiE
MIDRDDLGRRNAKVKRSWAKQAPRYDKSIGFFERRVFGSSHRAWAVSRVSGDVLEVAIGTGLNLDHYPANASVTGLDLSPEMLQLARARADELGRKVELQEGDAHALPFENASFDAVVCTYSLCNIPDPLRAISEMKRVLRPGGKLVLVDHTRSEVRPVYWVQKLLEFFSRRLEGEHLTRRPAEHVQTDDDLEIVERERLGWARIVERLEAVKL